MKGYGLNIRYQVHMLNVKSMILSVIQAYSWGMSFHNLLTVYKYTILPAITYASEAWSTMISKREKSNCEKLRDLSLYS